MKIPKTIRIVGFDWTIKEDKDVAHEGNVYGSTHHATQTIFLEPGLTVQKKEQVFLHEVLHALWWQMGLGKRVKDQKDPEEEIVHTLSHGLYQVLKDNNLLK